MKDAKIIIMLEIQLIELFHYLMDLRLGLINKKFEDIMLNHSNKDSLFYKQYIEVGKYSNQVKRYVKTFEKKYSYINYEDFVNVMLKMNLKKYYPFKY